jgi:hypothetical protein
MTFNKIKFSEVKNAMVELGADDGDLDMLDRFRKLIPLNTFKDFGSVDEFIGWAAENLISYVESKEAERRIAIAVTGLDIPEHDPEALESAETWADTANFQGSPKQVSWARSIAKKESYAICSAWAAKKQLPLAAKWWIDNRAQIGRALKGA